jgi:hypothetical protein
MSYENWKIAKSELEEKQEEYSAVAEWCNESGAYHIEEIGDEYCVVANPLPTVEEQNEAIKQTRANLYSSLIDPLHAEKQRKVVLGTWTEADEAEYIKQVKALTAKIQEENPYL